MSKEWIVNEEDLGCDGAYLSYVELIRCKDCRYQNEFGTLSGKNKKFCGINITGALGEDFDFCSAGKRRET